MDLKKLAILLLILLALAACGKKGPVRPKLLSLPAAPATLSVEQRGERLLLSWGIPETNQDGTPLTDLAGFRIERLRYDLDEACPDCRDDFRPVAEIDLDYLRQARRLGERLFWWDVEPLPGSGYTYRVLPVTARGRTGAPAMGRRLFLPVPPPPEQLAAEPHDRMVRLRWQPPTGETASGPVTGWHLYRWRATEPPALLPVARLPGEQTDYDDIGLENGQGYIYTVTTVVTAGDYPAESVPAAPVEATPAAGR